MHGELARHGPPSELQVQATEVLLPFDKEDLLLETNVGLKPSGGNGIVAQLVQQVTAVLAHGVIGEEEQGLLVVGLAVVVDEGAGDVGDAVQEEDGGGGVRGEVWSSRRQPCSLMTSLAWRSGIFSSWALPW